LGDPKGAGCVGRVLRDAVVSGGAGVTVRNHTQAQGRDRLVLAVPVIDGRGQVAAVLSADVDVVALLRAVVPPAGGASAMVVDLVNADVVAGNGLAIAANDPDRTLEWSVAPLWTLASGARLGLMELTPAAPIIPTAPPAAVGSGLYGLGLVVGVVLLIVVLGMTSYALGRSTRIHASRERIGALYREATTEPALDALTDLPTGAGFTAALSERIDAYLANGEAFALAVLDVDDLNAVNDREGRSAGDETLTALVATLRRMARSEDAIFRLGDDEFAMLMPGRAVSSAVADLERALHFSRRPAHGLRPVSFSGGVSGVPAFSTDQDIVMRQAEAALAWVKGHGRSGIEAYDPERDYVPDQPHDIANLAVREVVAGRLLSPVFQPIVDLRTGRILGFEGLIRPDPKGPLPDTAHLFAAASASGRTVELDLACIEVVLAGARAIGPDRLITINLSPRTLQVRDFDAAWLLDKLLRNGIAPGRVIVELTERDAVGDLPRLRQALKHLQSHGLRLAADDVGAGNAGLRLLSQVPFDIVKIDLSLVQDGVHQPGSRAVLESLRDLAISQNARIVAEGVETAEQLQVIRDLEIGAGQGYLLGRPIASVEATFVDLGQFAPGMVVPEIILPDVIVPDAPAPKLALGGAAAMASRPLRWGLSPGTAARR
jgi:diguanylate cyclase (GGDEF)-like protein